MDDSNQTAKMEEDIRLYTQEVVDLDVFKVYGSGLAKFAGGLFQWELLLVVS